MAFNKYIVQADTYAPELKPKSNPEDMKKIKSLYNDISKRLEGIEDDLEKCQVEKFVISFIKRGGLADETENEFESEDD
mgnify:CR=1 FL=1